MEFTFLKGFRWLIVANTKLHTSSDTNYIETLVHVLNITALILRGHLSQAMISIKSQSPRLLGSFAPHTFTPAAVLVAVVEPLGKVLGLT